MSTEFYALLDDMRKTFSVGIDRVSDKLDEVRSNMATHREVDELKIRMSRQEDSIESIRQESVKRGELKDEIKLLREENKALRESVEEIKSKQGKLPGWLWSIIISTTVGIVTIYLPHMK